MKESFNSLTYGEEGAHPTPTTNTQTGQASAAKPPEESSSTVVSRWMRIARLAWYPAALLAFCIGTAAVPGFIIIGSGGVTDPRFIANPSPAINIITWSAIVIGILVSFSSLFLALFLFRRRSNDRMALLTSFFLLAYGIIISGPLEALEPFVPGIGVFTSSSLVPTFQPFILLLFAVFPDGRFVPRWVRWVILSAFLTSPLSLFWTRGFGDPSFNYSDPGIIILIGLNVLLTGAAWVTSISAQIYRYRRVSNTQQKQQTKWMIYGIGVWITSQAITSVPWVYAYSLPPGSPYPIWLAAAAPIWLISIAIVPLTLSIAIMRYRLFEIDFIINRSLLYGGLTIGVISIHILVVVSLGAFFQAQGDLIIALLATGIVAVLFQPLRERLQRGVNRLVFGERDDPFETLSRLGRQLEASVPPDAVLPMLVETIAQSLKLPYVGILLTVENEDRIAAEYGTASEDDVRFPLLNQGESIGHLVVALHSPGSPFSPSELRLLRNIAQQAGAAIHAVLLTADVQRSRQRLVTAREEERRRLRRDLHDGLGSTLAALHIQTNAVRRMIHSDPETAETMVGEFKGEIREAIAGIRRVVYELRPPTLDEMGLVGAAQAFAVQCAREASQQTSEEEGALAINIDAPDDVPPLPAAVEVAAYHIIREALTNVVTHAKASSCLVRIEVNEKLNLAIVDNGVGILPDQPYGVGMISMRERAEELGGVFEVNVGQNGGTTLAARLPLVEE